jgi:hypothetical protein
MLAPAPVPRDRKPAQPLETADPAVFRAFCAVAGRRCCWFGDTDRLKDTSDAAAVALQAASRPRIAPNPSRGRDDDSECEWFTGRLVSLPVDEDAETGVVIDPDAGCARGGGGIRRADLLRAVPADSGFGLEGRAGGALLAGWLASGSPTEDVSLMLGLVFPRSHSPLTSRGLVLAFEPVMLARRSQLGLVTFEGGSGFDEFATTALSANEAERAVGGGEGS